VSSLIGERWLVRRRRRPPAELLEVVRPVDAGVRERAYELGGTLAATLMA
jgi:hypothetical protein